MTFHHITANSHRYHTNFKWPYFRTAGGYGHMVGHAGSPICIAHTWPDPTSRSLIFWSSENWIFLYLPLLLFWCGTHNWWVMMIVWDLVYSFLEPDFWISPPVSSKFAKCWYHQNPLCFISALADARSLWLWLQVGYNNLCMLAAMTVSPLQGFFISLCTKASLFTKFHENPCAIIQVVCVWQTHRMTNTKGHITTVLPSCYVKLSHSEWVIS